MTREEAIAVLESLSDNPLLGYQHKAAFNIAIHDIKQRHDWDINNLILINKDNYEPLEQEPCEDCISRKDILNCQYTIDESETLGISTRNVVNVDDILNAKPVQPKYNVNEWCKDCKEYDHDKYCCQRYNKVIRKTVEEMKQPCENAISRAEALKAINKMDIPEDMSVFEIKSHIGVEIGTLPPVQPKTKTGHWIFDEILDRNYYCSECKSMGVDYWDYCPYCGCRMIEPQESEDKE